MGYRLFLSDRASEGIEVALAHAMPMKCRIT